MFTLALIFVNFLALSGLMAAIDAAVLSVTQPEIEVLIDQGRWGSKRLRRIKQDIARTLVVIVILTNTINVLGPIFVSLQAFKIWGPASIAMVTVVLALGTIVFSEIIPKAVGARYAPLIARWAAPVILAIKQLLFPLVASLGWISSRFTRGNRKVGTEEQIRALVKLGHMAGHIEQDEGQMIHRVFILNDKTAGEIMTPLNFVKAIASNATIRQAAELMGKHEYSRLPVFGKSPDEVKGIALSREVLYQAQHNPGAAVTMVTKDPVIVNAEVKSDELIELFRDRNSELAIVRDSGKTVGVVTLHDVLQQVIGSND